MKMVKPNYSARTPVFNDNHYTDARPAIGAPTIGSPQASFNPGGNASMLPNGPPRAIQVPGKRPMAKGLTNKRLPMNNL